MRVDSTVFPRCSDPSRIPWRISVFLAAAPIVVSWGSCVSGAMRDRGKQIEDVFPIAQPIPIVVGAYRLLYQLISDFYIVVVDLDHHSPFLAMDVLSKVREVVYQAMKGNPEYKQVEIVKIVFYYAFRRCINGMEGLSVLDTPLRQIRLANDPLFSEYTTDNTLYDINDINHEREVSHELQDYRLDAWDAVLQVSVRVSSDLDGLPAPRGDQAHREAGPEEGEVRRVLRREVSLRRGLHPSTELPNHLVPATAITPMAEMIMDESYEAGQALPRLTAVESALGAELAAQAFAAFRVEPLLPGSAAVCRPLGLDAEGREKEGEKEDAGVLDEKEEDDVELAVAADAIAVGVPAPNAGGRAAAEPASASAGATAEAGAGSGETKPVDVDATIGAAGKAGEEAEAEELNVVQVNGTVEEMVKTMWGWAPGVMGRQTREGVSKVLLEGKIAVRPVGFSSEMAAIPLIIRNANYEFTPIEGLCELVKDEGAVKTFCVKLPLNTTEPREVLTYQGPMEAERAPLTAQPLSSREGNVTTVNMAVTASAKLQAEITAMSLLIGPPMLNEKGDGTKPVGEGSGWDVARHQPEGRVPEAVAANSMEGSGRRHRRGSRLFRAVDRGRRAGAQGQARLGLLHGQRRRRVPGHPVGHLAGDRGGRGPEPALHVPEARVPGVEPLQVSVQAVALFVLEALFYFVIFHFLVRQSEVGCARRN